MAKIILVVINSREYMKGVAKVLKTIVVDNNIIYITTNKPFSHMKNALEEAKIKTEKMLFIDCISKMVGEKVDRSERCVFLDGPSSLTAMGIAVNEAVKQVEGKKTVFFDSLSTLMLYNDAGTLSRFSHFLFNRMKTLEVDTAILALDSDVSSSVVKQIESIADKVMKE